MISYQEAIELIDANTPLLEVEMVALERSAACAAREREAKR